MNKNITNQSGQSIIEISMAIGIIAIVSVSIVSFFLFNFDVLSREDQIGRAKNIVAKDIESVISIKDRAWNEFIYNQSVTNLVDDEWILSGEGTSALSGKYFRNIFFYDVYKNNLGEIVDISDPEAKLDINSKKVLARATWDRNPTGTSSVEYIYYLSNWKSEFIEQSDWSAGPDQDKYLDIKKFYSMNSIDYESSPGSIFPAEVATSTFASSSELISSAFKIDEGGNFNYIKWSESIPSDCAECLIKFQIKTAEDNSGSPVNWSSDWCGPEGENGDESDFFVNFLGEMFSRDHQGDTWIRYKVIIEGTESKRASLEQIEINYNK